MTLDPTATYPITCPACSKVRNATQPIPPGTKVRCKCGHTFIPVPVEGVVVDLDLSSISPEPKPVIPAVQIQADAVQSGLKEDQVSLGDLEQGLEEDRLGVERGATLTDLWKVLNSIESSILGAVLRGPAEAAPREYKVVTQKDKWFSGKFDPEKVEGALNAYAKQGWTLKGVATASVPGFGGQRDEIVIIMER